MSTYNTIHKESHNNNNNIAKNYYYYYYLGGMPVVCLIAELCIENYNRKTKVTIFILLAKKIILLIREKRNDRVLVAK